MNKKCTTCLKNGMEFSFHRSGREYKSCTTCIAKSKARAKAADPVIYVQHKNHTVESGNDYYLFNEQK